VELKPAVAGRGAITALGNGVAPILESVRVNSSGLRPGPPNGNRSRETSVAGWIPEDAENAVAAAHGGPEDARAFRLAREAMRQAIDGSPWNQCAATRRGLVLATTKADLPALERLHAGGPCSPEARRHARPALLAVDLAAACEVAGPVRCVSVACVSGLLAVQQASRLIQRGLCDVVMVVGVDLLSHFVLTGFMALKSLDPEGCRPFDRARVGLSVGEAGAAIVLARSDRVFVPAWRVRGWGSSNDANHLTGPSRDGSGLALALDRALQVAGMNCREIDYLNAHGTGTPFNDAMEAHAFRRVFGESIPPFGSSKGMFGHTLGAAGILETIVCLTALDAGLLPGTPRLSDPDPVVPPSVLQLPRPANAARTMVKVNCGFGGTNAALVLEKDETPQGSRKPST